MTKTPLTWTNCKVKLGDLKPWDDNPRESTQEDADHILASFEEFNQVEVFAIGPGNEVYDGHQRLGVLLKKFGPKHEVDARRASRELTAKERKKLVVLLHEGATGRWNVKKLGSWDAGELKDWGLSAETLGSLSLVGGGDEEGAEKTEELRPMNMARVLISFPVDASLEVSDLLNEIAKVQGVEIDYGAN